MSSVERKTRLLIVDTSPSMAQVLKTYAEFSNYEADVFSDSAQACKALSNRFSNPDSSRQYDCMILGWPMGQVGIISDLLTTIGSVDQSDLPLIVLTEDPDKDVQMLVRRRAKTRTLLWAEYKRIESLLQSMVVRDTASIARPASVVVGTNSRKPATKNVLLVDDTTAVCQPMRDMLESNGYQVTLAVSAADARSAIARNNFDLVVTEFFLRGESGEQLCRYLQSMNASKRPVYAVMTRKNIDSVVQLSLAAGAIACLDKGESTETLCARIDAIAKGISGRSNVQAGSNGVQGLVDASQTPSILINEKRIIVAANMAAVSCLSAGNSQALQNKSFEKAIHGAPVKRSSDEPVKALFRTLTGGSLSVVYRSRDIDGAQFGLSGDLCVLTFETLDVKTPAIATATNATTAAVTTAKSAAMTSAVSGTVAKTAGIEELIEPQSARPESAVALPVKQLGEPDAIAAIEKALSSDDTSIAHSLLMLDIKMVASITGDRLSLGKSEPMLEMVKSELGRHYTRKDSLIYVGRGRFALLFESGVAAQARALATRLVQKIPGLIEDLADVKLLSHAAFLELPRQSDFSGRHILNHCTAACLKTETDGLDNAIFDINAHEKLKPGKSRVSTVASNVARETSRSLSEAV